MSGLCRRLTAATALVAAASVAEGGTSPANDDSVAFAGSLLVGEMKRLTRGKLSFETDATGTIEIDWAEVSQLVTARRLRVERRDGTTLIGSLVPGAPPGQLALRSQGGTRTYSLPEVIGIEPIEIGFGARLDASVSMGYSYTRATGVEEFDLAADFEYETERRSRTLSLSSRRSESDGSDSSDRRTAEYRDLRIQPGSPWFSGWAAGYEDNSALNLDLRVQGTFLVGREYYPLVNQRLRPFAGLSIGRQRYADDDGETTTDLVLGGFVDWYRFTSPELDLSSALTIYPSLRHPGEGRASLDLALRWELIDELFWEISLYDDYDSEAADGDAQGSTNDYGVTTSLGWSW